MYIYFKIYIRNRIRKIKTIYHIIIIFNFEEKETFITDIRRIFNVEQNIIILKSYFTIILF